MAYEDAWAQLGPLGGDERCGYTHDDHVQDGVPLVCVRAPGHPGGTEVLARDMHLADIDGQPVLFGDPLVFDPVTGEVVAA